MLICPKCKKEIVIMGISIGAVPDEAIGEYNKDFELHNKLILWNPPPFETYYCPQCNSKLIEN